MERQKIGVIGLGYVGLPLACLFSERHDVIGFDINRELVDRISAGIDVSGELDSKQLRKALDSGLRCTSDSSELTGCNVFIVAVPTPVDLFHKPDLTALENASTTVGTVITPGACVIFESTVYPGVTEEFCAPIIETVSGLYVNKDFMVGYSPERINPGDKEHTVRNITKITSGSSPEAADFIDALYNSVLTGGTYKASSIRIAEAAKIIENSQRDVNIAFMNEIVKVFNSIGVDTLEVLEAASTKWNFMNFRPGLVGGHCIGVDPYYLIHRAEMGGLQPRLMNEARRINDGMGCYISNRIVTKLSRLGRRIEGIRILILGFTFKENCRDTRNTRVIDIVHQLEVYRPEISLFDPMVEVEKVKREYGLDIVTDIKEIEGKSYDVIVYCVDHDCFKTYDFKKLLAHDGLFFCVSGGICDFIDDEDINTTLRRFTAAVSNSQMRELQISKFN